MVFYYVPVNLIIANLSLAEYRLDFCLIMGIEYRTGSTNSQPKALASFLGEVSSVKF